MQDEQARQEMPAFEPPAWGERPRFPIGWFALFCLFALLIVAALTDSNREKEPGPSIFQEEAGIRNAITLQRAIQSAAPPDAKLDPAEQLKPALEGLEKKSARSSEAAELLIAARHEVGLEVTGEQLALLQRSPERVRRAFRLLYGSKEPSKEDAARAAELLPRNSFARRLALVHANESAGQPSDRARLFPSWKAWLAMAAMIGGTVALFGGLALWAIYVTARRSGQLKPAGHPAEPLSPRESDAFALRAAVVIAFFAILMPAVGKLLSTGFNEAASRAIGGGLFVALIALLYRTRFAGLPDSLERAGVSSKNLGKNILWGVAAFAANVPIMAVVLILSQQLMRFLPEPSHPAVEMLRQQRDVATVASIAFLAVIVAPFWEELVFRGTIMPALSRLLRSPAWGIVASSLLFASIHPQGLALWLGLGMVGVMTAALVYQTGSLVPSMVLHFLHNGAVLTIGLVFT